MFPRRVLAIMKSWGGGVIEEEVLCFSVLAKCIFLRIVLAANVICDSEHIASIGNFVFKCLLN